jgi:hypothetical protein
MKDEIIKRLKDSLEYEFPLSFNERKQLLNYITNLQEENKRLKDYLKIMEKGKDNNLHRFLDYKQRIDKAIEKTILWGEILDKDFQKELLDILRGDE